jgi:hypothetical protein
MDNWIGLTVAQVLALCSTPYRDVTMVDEPPGKLRALEFDCQRDGRVVRTVLELAYQPTLFSVDRTWDEELVGRQRIVGVREPGGVGY